MTNRIIHPFLPIYDCYSKVLILGSFPSVKSREGEFYYHHPQNRFWKVICTLYHEELPGSVEQKKNLLLRNGIALWDVIKSCEIIGSSDSSIKNVIVNNILEVIESSNIKSMIANGGTAYQLYRKHIFPITGMDIIKMPSTSPANAAYSLEKLIKDWSYLMTITQETKG